MNYGYLKTLLLMTFGIALVGCTGGTAPTHAQREAPGYSWTLDGVLLQTGASDRKILVRLPDWHWAGEPYGCGPALTVGPKGEIVVTSDVVPTLWRIDRRSLAVSVHPLVLDADFDKDIGFSSISYSARHGAYFAVSHDHGSLWRIDPLLRRAQKTLLTGPLPKGCATNWAIHLSPDQRSGFLLSQGRGAR